VGIASIVGAYLMSLYTGQGHNMELALTAEPISGERAYEIGFVSQLCSEDALLESAMARARQMASLPRLAVRLTKKRNRELTQPGFVESFIAGSLAQLACASDGERQATIRDFLARRDVKRSAV
jgi:enoyl-CoA hydratase/carnithine racemase